MRGRRLLELVIGAAVAGATPVAAQEVVAVRAGRLVDVDRGEVRRDQLIVIRGERIESILPGTSRLPRAPG